MTMAAGIGALTDRKYFADNCRAIEQTREWTSDELRALGFTVLDSKANFVFAAHGRISGKELYLKLKQNGILVRHFDSARLTDFNRITIGSMEQMRTLISTIKKILEDMP